MSTLVPVSASVTHGADGVWTLTSSVTPPPGVTYAYTYNVNNMQQIIGVLYTLPPAGESVTINVGAITLDATLFVYIGPLSPNGGGYYQYMTSVEQQLSSKITVGAGNASGTYTPTLDFNPPTSGNPRKVYSSGLYNTAIDVYGYGIYPVSMEQDGSGKCYYLGGSTTSIAAAPAFILQPVSQAIAVGQNVTFNCVYTSTGMTTAEWYKDGSTLVYTDTSIYVGSTSSYTITGVALGDMGSYTCKVINGYGNTTSDAAVLSQHVSVTPALSIDVGSTLTVNEGSSASITATLTAGTISVFNWYGTDYIFDTLKYDVPNSGSSNAISSGTGGYLWVPPATSTYTKTWTSADNGKVIHIAANGWYPGDGGVTASVTVSVTPVATAPPVLVTSPPSAINLTFGDTSPSSMSASFTGTGSLTYAWYTSTDNGATWVSQVPGPFSYAAFFGSGDTNTLTWGVPPGYNIFSIPAGQPLINAGVYWIRCGCSNSVGTTYSNHCVWTLSSGVAIQQGYRPTAGTGATTYPNAIDTTGITVDNTTHSDHNSASAPASWLFSNFGTGTFNGELHVRATGTTTTDSSIDYGDAISSIEMTYAYNDGSQQSLFYSDGNAGGDPSSATPIVSSHLVGIDISTLTFTLHVNGSRVGPTIDRAQAAAFIQLYDVVFITS